MTFVAYSVGRTELYLSNSEGILIDHGLVVLISTVVIIGSLHLVCYVVYIVCRMMCNLYVCCVFTVQRQICTGLFIQFVKRNIYVRPKRLQTPFYLLILTFYFMI